MKLLCILFVFVVVVSINFSHSVHLSSKYKNRNKQVEVSFEQVQPEDTQGLCSDLTNGLTSTFQTIGSGCVKACNAIGQSIVNLFTCNNQELPNRPKRPKRTSDLSEPQVQAFRSQINLMRSCMGYPNTIVDSENDYNKSLESQQKTIKYKKSALIAKSKSELSKIKKCIKETCERVGHSCAHKLHLYFR